LLTLYIFALKLLYLCLTNSSPSTPIQIITLSLGTWWYWQKFGFPPVFFGNHSRWFCLFTEKFRSMLRDLRLKCQTIYAKYVCYGTCKKVIQNFQTLLLI
jgi:hypothetical protein